MMLTLGLYTYFSKTFSDKRRVQIRTKKNSEKASEFYLNESIMNYETVKSFNNERLENNRYSTLLEKLRTNAVDVQFSLSQLNIGQSMIFLTGLSINLMMAANEVCNGTMTPGDFVMISAYFTQLAGPLFNMGTLFREVAQSQVDMEDLFNMLQQKPRVKESPDARDFEFKQGAIEFKGVSFGHPLEESQEHKAEMQYLFRDLDLKIEPGTTNAIVGPSGFGKTTMLHLLYRIFDPANGSIFIDGQDVKDLKFESFRKYISVVPQNGILFNDTIEFNLRYGNQDATQEDIEKIAIQCSIHERIMSMPDGYQT